jgi:hypothetical protein
MQGLEKKASAKQKGIDIIQRTLIITIFLVVTQLTTIMASGLYLGRLVEIFMYSILNAYYCYEYKTAMLEMDLLSSLGYFEAQLAYYCGFGTFYTLLLYLLKGLGSSLFFLIFPVMVIISLDEDGVGLLAYKDSRATETSLPIFTLVYYVHKFVLRKVNHWVLGAPMAAS